MDETGFTPRDLKRSNTVIPGDLTMSVKGTSKRRERITRSTTSTSGLSKTFCDASVVKLYYFKYPPPPHTPYTRLRLPAIPAPTSKLLSLSKRSALHLPDRGRWEGGGGEAVSGGSTWLRRSLDQGPQIGHEHGAFISLQRSACDTVTGQR